jgi:uracil-DNA glycosylase
MNNNWKPYLEEETKKPYFVELKKFLVEQKNAGKVIYPKPENIYTAFNIAPENVKVVILGQDPYHGENQAHGMSFSVLPGVKPPPSLKNIYKEIEQEFNYKMDEKNGYLMPWAEQGVMLINSVMTVEASNPASHKGMGWETFTDKVIHTLSDNFEHIVFMLWGSYAKAKSSLIDNKKHLILTSAHPSPFSAYNGFFGNNHFKKANEYLKANGHEEINWKI